MSSQALEFKLAMEWIRPLSLVSTPDGIGRLLNIDIPFNGLYFSPEQAKFTVWYGTSNAQNGWVSRQYNLDELSPVINQ